MESQRIKEKYWHCQCRFGATLSARTDALPGRDILSEREQKKNMKESNGEVNFHYKNAGELRDSACYMKRLRIPASGECHWNMYAIPETLGKESSSRTPSLSPYFRLILATLLLSRCCIPPSRALSNSSFSRCSLPRALAKPEPRLRIHRDFRRTRSACWIFAEGDDESPRSNSLAGLPVFEHLARPSGPWGTLPSCPFSRASQVDRERKQREISKTLARSKIPERIIPGSTREEKPLRATFFCSRGFSRSYTLLSYLIHHSDVILFHTLASIQHHPLLPLR